MGTSERFRSTTRPAVPVILQTLEHADLIAYMMPVEMKSPELAFGLATAILEF